MHTKPCVLENDSLNPLRFAKRCDAISESHVRGPSHGLNVAHDEAKLISKTLLACNLSRSKTQRQSRRLKYALNKASWL
jgi:hypothetical protein